MFKGPRVLIRTTKREDMQRQWEFENDPELWFFDGGAPKPTKLETVLHYFDESVSGDNSSSVSFSIEVEGNYIGHCGLDDFDLVNK